MMGEAILNNNIDQENIRDTLVVDTEHLHGASLGLEVFGDSMIDGGIRDGDYALIRLQSVPNEGEIVAVAIFPEGEGGDLAEATLKKYYRLEKPAPHHHLQPMNSAIPDILVIPQKNDVVLVKEDYTKRGIKTQSYVGEVNIIGKLVAIWRKAEK